MCFKFYFTGGIIKIVKQQELAVNKIPKAIASPKFPALNFEQAMQRIRPQRIQSPRMITVLSRIDNMFSIFGTPYQFFEIG